MPLNPSGAISLAGPVVGQSIALEIGQSATAQISLNDALVRLLAGVPSGAIVMPTNFYGKALNTQKAIFAFGQTAVAPLAVGTNVSNLVSSTGVVATDTPGVGTARYGIGGSSYGGDKAIFGFGGSNPGVAPNPLTLRSMTNLVSNTGVVAADTPGVGTARVGVAATTYGTDKAIFGYGGNVTGTPSPPPGTVTTVNLVSSAGVVATDTPSVATALASRGAATYSTYRDKAFFVGGTGFFNGDFANTPPLQSASQEFNLVSNTGVVASATLPPVWTRATGCAAASYGGDKAIAAFGRFTQPPPTTIATANPSYHLISNTGVMASATPLPAGVTARGWASASPYGSDKAIFAFASSTTTPTLIATSNLVSNTGVLATDTPGVGTVRRQSAGAGFSFSA